METGSIEKTKEYCGIDVSKDRLDAHLYLLGVWGRFANNPGGFMRLFEWLARHGLSPKTTLFVFEHTGAYSLRLSMFLDEGGYAFSMVSGLCYSKSKGLSRGKEDPADARSLAEYGYEKRHRLPLTKLPGERLMALKRLASFRERLVRDRTAYKNRLGSYQDSLDPMCDALLFEANKAIIEYLSQAIKRVDREMLDLVKQDPTLQEQFVLLNSIKGVGPQTALCLIILTQGFTAFKEWRQFACYAGTAPFPNQSGNYKGKHRVSCLANKRAKTLLSCCAATAVQHDPELRHYYQRRLAEGKHEMSIINAVRNKILARMFAVVKRGTPFVDTFRHAA